jgi:hypothetical protein
MTIEIEVCLLYSHIRATRTCSQGIGEDETVELKLWFGT